VVISKTSADRRWTSRSSDLCAFIDEEPAGVCFVDEMELLDQQYWAELSCMSDRSIDHYSGTLTCRRWKWRCASVRSTVVSWPMTVAVLSTCPTVPPPVRPVVLLSLSLSLSRSSNTQHYTLVYSYCKMVEQWHAAAVQVLLLIRSEGQ